MNGKQAKRLRREAEAATVGAPRKVYERRDNHVVVDPKTDIAFNTPGTIRLCNYTDGPRCTRAAYQKMKRGSA